jgi:putative tricarboxylic transport membrane protein
MNSASIAKRRGHLVLGGAGVLLSMVYLGASLQLPFGRMATPGEALFPVLSAVVLFGASLATIWEGWRMEPSEQVELLAGANLQRLLGLLGLIVGYLLALPWVGNLIARTTFVALLIRLRSGVTWPRSIAYAVTMAVAIHVVFVTVLNVPMPRGVLVP